MNKSSNILCVCTHNYFRSVLMEHLLRARGYVYVRSGGTRSAYLRQPPHPLVLAAIQRHGGSCADYRPVNVNPDDVAWADIILAAEQEHVADLQKRFSELLPTDIRILEVADGGIDNPEAVERAAAQIQEWLEKWS